jgi:hypothetical protein
MEGDTRTCGVGSDDCVGGEWLELRVALPHVLQVLGHAQTRHFHDMRRHNIFMHKEEECSCKPPLTQKQLAKA